MIGQDAMRKAEAAGNNDCPVKIKLVAPPLYVLTTQTLDKVCQTLMQIVSLLTVPLHDNCMLSNPMWNR